MVKTTVRWLADRHFVGTDSSNHSVVLSGQKEGIGVSPSEMLLIALASCSSVDQEKYCSVAATVRGVARITVEYEIVPDEYIEK